MSEQKSKNPLQKLKEKFDDKEEQLEILGTFIRLGVMVWSGFIISLNYITIPGMAKDNSPKDITFIASVFTGCLATFSVDVGKKKKEEKLDKPKEVAQSDNSYQTIRVETPIKIIGATVVDPNTKK
tara:strand:- start:153 stop:530 length:378 start_codon:yes stop_codon:yes gene_type:complete